MKTPPTATLPTDCNEQPLLFQDLGPRKVVTDFSGGTLSTDGGALLLREVNRRLVVKHARQIVVDLDAMGHLLHGTQEGRHFSAYYDDYCYLPLYVFVGDVPLWAQLRTSDQDAASGVVPALEKIVAAIRKRCQRARIIIRGDSGFCRDEIMAWCERQPRLVYYCLGLAKNRVLIEKLQPALARARARRCL